MPFCIINIGRVGYEMKRVVVTGMGAVTPIGITVEKFWESVLEGKVGIGPIQNFDTTQYKAKLSAEVIDFDPKAYIEPKAAKRMDRFSQMAVTASIEAMQDSGLNIEEEDSYRLGVCVGSGVGSLMGIEREYDKMLAKGPGRIHPLTAPLVLGNMAAASVAMYHGFQGKCIDVVTACATGTNSIGEAFSSIQHGEADVMFAGGTESSISPIGIGGFAALTALSTSTDPKRASIPFDKERNGFVMGEGAGVVVLEELEHALKRGAHIYAEITGYGCSSDAYHITSPMEDGSGAAYAMTSAMKEAEVKPDDIDYINAHGTSTHHNDLFETRAIKLALKDAAYNVPVSSTKSMVGHLLGAAGAVEFIACVKSIQDGYIHPNVGLSETEEEMDLNYVKDEGIEKDVDVVMTNSLGFGGHNATLIVRKYS